MAKSAPTMLFMTRNQTNLEIATAKRMSMMTVTKATTVTSNTTRTATAGMTDASLSGLRLLGLQ